MKYNTKIVLAYFNECGLPHALSEHKFHPNRKWRFDFAWPYHHLALEVEGGVFTRGAHGSVSGILRDMEKYNAAAVLGWRVIRVLPNDLCTQSVVAMIAQAINFTILLEREKYFLAKAVSRPSKGSPKPGSSESSPG